MLHTIDSVMEEQNLSRIDKIVIEVGEISGIVPMFMEECYNLMVPGTKYENTKLEIELVKGIVRCNQCKIEFNAVENNYRCPVCGAQDMEPLSGREFYIKEIVAC